MNIFGKYPTQEFRGATRLNPAIFVTTNWPVLCDIASVPQMKDKLTIVRGAEHDPSKDTAAFSLNPDNGKIIVNTTDLGIDVYQFNLSGLNALGLLWGGPAGMIRALLFRDKLLPADERLTVDFMRRARWPENIITTMISSAKFPEGTEEFDRRMDTLIVSGAVLTYCQALAPKEDMDTRRIAKLIWAERTKVNPKRFKLNLK